MVQDIKSAVLKVLPGEYAVFPLANMFPTGERPSNVTLPMVAAKTGLCNPTFNGESVKATCTGTEVVTTLYSKANCTGTETSDRLTINEADGIMCLGNDELSGGVNA